MIKAINKLDIDMNLVIMIKSFFVNRFLFIHLIKDISHPDNYNSLLIFNCLNILMDPYMHTEMIKMDFSKQ